MRLARSMTRPGTIEAPGTSDGHRHSAVPCGQAADDRARICLTMTTSMTRVAKFGGLAISQSETHGFASRPHDRFAVSVGKTRWLVRAIDVSANAAIKYIGCEWQIVKKNRWCCSSCDRPNSEAEHPSAACLVISPHRVVRSCHGRCTATVDSTVWSGCRARHVRSARAGANRRRTHAGGGDLRAAQRSESGLEPRPGRAAHDGQRGLPRGVQERASRA